MESRRTCADSHAQRSAEALWELQNQLWVQIAEVCGIEGPLRVQDVFKLNLRQFKSGILDWAYIIQTTRSGKVRNGLHHAGRICRRNCFVFVGQVCCPSCRRCERCSQAHCCFFPWCADSRAPISASSRFYCDVCGMLERHELPDHPMFAKDNAKACRVRRATFHGSTDGHSLVLKRNKKLLAAPGIATRSKDATRRSLFSPDEFG